MNFLFKLNSTSKDRRWPNFLYESLPKQNAGLNGLLSAFADILNWHFRRGVAKEGGKEQAATETSS
jgi:hypothetical protein